MSDQLKVGRINQLSDHKGSLPPKGTIVVKSPDPAPPLEPDAGAVGVMAMCAAIVNAQTFLTIHSCGPDPRLAAAYDAIRAHAKCEQKLQALRMELAQENARLRTVLAKYAEPDSWRLSGQWGNEPWQLAADALAAPTEKGKP